MKLKKTLFIVLAACTLAPVLVSAAVFIHNSAEQERKLIVENMEMSAKVFASSIENFFEINRTDMVVTFNGPLLQQFIKKRIGDGVIVPRPDVDVLTDVFKARVRLSNAIDTVSIIDADGTVILSSNAEQIGKHTLIGDARFELLRSSNKNIVSNSFANPDGNAPPLFVLATPLFKGEVFRGALVFVATTDFIQQMVHRAGFFKSYRSGSITVVDAKGNIVASSNQSLKLAENIQDYISKAASYRLLEKSGGANESLSGNAITYAVKGVKRIGYYTEVSDTGWKILCSVGAAELLKPVQQMVLLSIGFVIALLVVVTVIFFVVIKSFTQPMYALLAAIRGMRNGDRNARFDYHEDDEFGEIASAYNDLVDKTQGIIDKEKKRSEFLLDKSSHDQLTGLYNKAATQELISECLSEGGSHALFIMDIDKFKNINDTYGHGVGDAVIAATAAGIKALSRESDVAGRIGGDEYMLFLRNIGNIEVIRAKAEEIKAAFHAVGDAVPEIEKLSGSIGCSRCPADGTTFEELYKAADEALYESKERGRDGWTIKGDAEA